MSIGANIPDRVKTELNLAIAEAARTYQEENDRYFSRNRILDVETMMKLLISMQGGSLQKELHEAGISATASAFVQSRKKLSWMDFEKILDVFNSYHPNAKPIKGIVFLLLMELRSIYQEIQNQTAICATRVCQKATINYTSHHYMMCLTRHTYIA